MEERENILINLSNLFEKGLSDPLRKSLIGEKIDRILTKYFDRISPEQLASALLSRYGSDLFKPKYRILETIVNRLDSNEIKNLAYYLNVSTSANNIYDVVIEKIPTNIDSFLKYFEQSSYFLQQKPKDERKSQEKISIDYGQSINSLGFPHGYQNRVKLEVLNQLKKSSGKFSALVVMPTGSGKTRTAIEFMIDFIRNKRSCNILWIVDSPELSEQSLKSFKELWLLRGDREIIVNRCYGKFEPFIKNSQDLNIIFAGFDKLNGLRQNSSDSYEKISKNTHLLIIDEAHYSLAETYEELVDDIERKSKDLIKIGLTATPLRPDDTEFYNLKKYFDNRIIDFKDDANKIIKDPLKHLQKNDYLAEIIPEYFSIKESEIHEDSRELNDKIIERLKVSVSKNKQVIVFAMSKYHAIALNILFKHENIDSDCIVGETSSLDRQNIFDRFLDKQLNVIVNFDILSTGIDLPKVDELFLLRKFGQYTTAMQVLGRALRGLKNGGNKENRVISLKSNQQIIDNPSDLFILIKNMY